MNLSFARLSFELDSKLVVDDIMSKPIHKKTYEWRKKNKEKAVK